VGEFDDRDQYATLDLLEVLVRKSLVVADRSAGRTRFSVLETIRQFADEQLIASGEAAQAHTAHARHFARLGTDMLTLWDSPLQHESYAWFTAELANLRKAFRWAIEQSDLDTAVTIAADTAMLGYGIDNYEPVAWAEELIEPARAEDHPQLATLYLMASQCWLPGRMEAALRYSHAGQLVLADSGSAVPFGAEGLLTTSWMNSGQPDRAIDWCRTNLAFDRDTHAITRSCLVFALVVAGSSEQAIVAASDLVEVAEASRNPFALTFALLVYGLAFRHTDQPSALDALRRGLATAQDSANRSNESQLAICLSSVEADSGEPMAAFDHVTLAIRNLHDSGNTTTVSSPLAILAALFDGLGHYEPAATIAGFAVNPFTAAAVPELITAIDHLRGVLGEPTYEALAHAGQAMSNAEIVAYAYEQVDRARLDLGVPG
jgi:hypothetical protein